MARSNNAEGQQLFGGNIYSMFGCNWDAHRKNAPNV
jgi:hypothetical protein